MRARISATEPMDLVHYVVIGRGDILLAKTLEVSTDPLERSSQRIVRIIKKYIYPLRHYSSFGFLNPTECWSLKPHSTNIKLCPMVLFQFTSARRSVDITVPVMPRMAPGCVLLAWYPRLDAARNTVLSAAVYAPQQNLLQNKV